MPRVAVRIGGSPSHSSSDALGCGGWVGLGAQHASPPLQVPDNVLATYKWTICTLTFPTLTRCSAPSLTLQPAPPGDATAILTVSAPLPVGKYLVTVTATHASCAGVCPSATTFARITVRAKLSVRLHWVAPAAAGTAGLYSPSTDLIVEGRVTGGPVASYQWTAAPVAAPNRAYDLTSTIVAPSGISGQGAAAAATGTNNDNNNNNNNNNRSCTTSGC